MDTTTTRRMPEQVDPGTLMVEQCVKCERWSIKAPTHNFWGCEFWKSGECPYKAPYEAATRRQTP